ncbi:MAG: IclR family transcriptional regulator, partial [Stackebrandtia sp.]
AMSEPSPRNWESAKAAPAVLRAGAVLRALADSSGRALTSAELAAAGDMPRSSAMNICVALTQIGLVRAVGSGFTLGHGLMDLSQAYLDTLDPVREFGTQTSAMTPIDETLQLGTLEGSDVVYLAIHGGRTPVRITSRVGSRISATCTALGKAMLATRTDTRIRELLEPQQPFVSYTDNSITDIDTLLDDLDATRRRGYAIDAEETTWGVTCLAVAVPGLPNGAQSFAVSTSLLTSRAGTGRIDTLVGLIRDLVGKIGTGG